MPKKPGLTLEQHEKLGAELLTMRDRIGKIIGMVSKAYPYTIFDPVHKAQDIIDRLRADLDSKVAEENIGNKRALNIYFRAKS